MTIRQQVSLRMGLHCCGGLPIAHLTAHIQLGPVIGLATEDLVTSTTLVCIPVVQETTSPRRAVALDIDFANETLGVTVTGFAASPHAVLGCRVDRTADGFAAML